jgi:hypothetical protein
MVVIAELYELHKLVQSERATEHVGEGEGYVSLVEVTVVKAPVLASTMVLRIVRFPA